MPATAHTTTTAAREARTERRIFARLAAPCGSRFPAMTEPTIELIVNHRAGLEVRANGDGSERVGDSCREVTLTADGRAADLTEWHTEADGAEGEWIYFERIAADGTGSHGWVDAESRKLLQAG